MWSILAAAAHKANVPVIQDVGGADRPISDDLLKHLTYICPNESELARLTGLPTGSFEQAVTAAKALQARGVQNVLVTLGSRGAFLLGPDGKLLQQGSCPVPGGHAVDETGAGDAFRAAFAVALVEGRSLPDCLRLAAAAGALAVSVKGAEPSLPTREAAEALAKSNTCSDEVAEGLATSSDSSATAPSAATPVAAAIPTATGAAPPAIHGPSADGFPLQFASRLNSMKDRLDLWDGESNLLGWIARMGTVKGMGLVDVRSPGSKLYKP